MFYIVKGTTSDGSIDTVSVDAPSEEAARSASGFTASRIISVRKDTIALLKQELLYPAPTTRDQTVFLSGLASQLVSGQDVKTSFRRLLTGNKRIKVNESEMRHTQTASEMLKVLRFDPMAITLAEVGERSGSLGESLQVAADNMMTQEQVKAQLGKGLWGGVTYLIFGLLLMTIIPIGIGPIIENILDQGQISIKTTVWTDLLLTFKSLYTEYFYIIPIIGSAIFFLRHRIWLYLRNIPPFTVINELIKMKRGIRFLVSYKPLYTSGVVVGDALKLLRNQSRGEDTEVYHEMLMHLRDGGDLASAIDTDYWPDSIRFGMSSFGNINEKQRLAVMDTLVKTSLLQQEAISSRIGSLAKFTGMLIIVFAIVAAALGFVLPMQGMKPA